jgi:hypothetical protein
MGRPIQKVGRNNSVSRLATGWTVRGSRPGGGEIFWTCPDRPGAHPASYTMGTGSFPGKSDWGMVLSTHPHPSPRLRKEYSYTSAPPVGLRGLL